MRDLLSSALFLLATLGYLRWTEHGRARCYLLATLAFILAILSKPAALILPGVVLVLDWLRLRIARGGSGTASEPGTSASPNRPRRSLIVSALALWVLIAIGSALMTVRIQPAAETYSAPIWARPFIAADAVAMYLYRLVVPIDFAIDYGRSPRWLIEHGPILITWIVPVALALLVAARAKRWPVVVASAAIFILVLLPVLGLVRFDFQTHSTIADRYAYPAMLAPALLLAWLLTVWRARWLRIAAGVAIVLLAVRSASLAGAWRDSLTLYTHTLRVNPTSLAANNGLGLMYMEAGRLADAERRFEAALQRDPDDPVTLSNYGALLVEGERDADAIEVLRRVLKTRSYPWLYTNLATALYRSGQRQEAGTVVAEGIERFPRSAELRASWGMLLLDQARPADAAEQFQAALRISPHFQPAIDGLAQARAAMDAATTRSATRPMVPATSPPR